MIELKKIEKKFEKFEIKERKKIRAHHFLFAFVGGVGVVLFWAGVWAIAENILMLHPFASLLLGIGILSFLGIFVIEIVGNEALVEGIEEVEETNISTAKKLDLFEERLEKFEKVMKKEVRNLQETIAQKK